MDPMELKAETEFINAAQELIDSFSKSKADLEELLDNIEESE